MRDVLVRENVIYFAIDRRDAFACVVVIAERLARRAVDIGAEHESDYYGPIGR